MSLIQISSSLFKNHFFLHYFASLFSFKSVSTKTLMLQCLLFLNKKRNIHSIVRKKKALCFNKFGLNNHKKMRYIDIPGICSWALKKWCTNMCTQPVCVHTYKHMFLFSGPGWGGGDAHYSRSFGEVPKYLQAKTRHLHCCVALRAMKMMIKMIPHTSPMIFRILAVLDASTATADSPRALAFCAFK